MHVLLSFAQELVNKIFFSAFIMSLQLQHAASVHQSDIFDEESSSSIYLLVLLQLVIFVSVAYGGGYSGLSRIGVHRLLILSVSKI